MGGIDDFSFWFIDFKSKTCYIWNHFRNQTKQTKTIQPHSEIPDFNVLDACDFVLFDLLKSRVCYMSEKMRVKKCSMTRIVDYGKDSGGR